MYLDLLHVPPCGSWGLSGAKFCDAKNKNTNRKCLVRTASENEKFVCTGAAALLIQLQRSRTCKPKRGANIFFEARK